MERLMQTSPGDWGARPGQRGGCLVRSGARGEVEAKASGSWNCGPRVPAPPAPKVGRVGRAGVVWNAGSPVAFSSDSGVSYFEKRSMTFPELRGCQQGFTSGFLKKNLQIVKYDPFNISVFPSKESDSGSGDGYAITHVTSRRTTIAIIISSQLGAPLARSKKLMFLC